MRLGIAVPHYGPALSSAGRDPQQLRQMVRVNGEPGESLEHIAERLARLAEDGVDEALVDFFFTYTGFERFLDAAERIADITRR